jgi:hypothetical protein
MSGNALEMPGVLAPLSPRQRKAIAHLAISPTRTAGLRAARLSARQLGRWLESPPFVRALEAAELEIYMDGMRHARRLATRAVCRLEELLDREKVQDAVALAVCMRILDLGQRAVSLLSFESRLRELEEGEGNDGKVNRAATKTA